MAKSHRTTSISISVETKARVRRFMRDIGVSKDNRAMDVIVNTVLDSPAAKQLQQVCSSKDKLSTERYKLLDENLKLKQELAGLKGSPAASFLNPFAKPEQKDTKNT